MSQSQFSEALLDANAPTPPNVVRPDGTPAVKRFAIYRNNVIVSLVEALSDGFPVVKKLVGADFFEAMAGAFVRANPPASPVMLYYGDKFADFIRQFPPAASLPYLGDIAGLEYARRLAYHAGDANPIPPDRLQAVEPEQLPNVHLRLHPSMQIVRSPYPVMLIWLANQEDEPRSIEPVAETVLISRPQSSVQMRVIDLVSSEFLQALQSGKTLGEAAEAATNSDPGFDLAHNLGGIFEAQLLIDIA